MFNKKFKKQTSIFFDDEETSKQQDQEVERPKIIQAKKKIGLLNYDEELDDNEQLKKYVRISNRHSEPIKESMLSTSYNYLKELEEENRMNNYLAKKSMENINELNIIDLENDGIYDTNPGIKKQQNKIEIIDVDQTEYNLINDMDDKRMNMLGIVKQQKYFYNENSDDEELNRLEDSLIKSNRVHYECEDGNGNGHKAFSFNDSQQMNYCSFMDNFSQINLESIIGNVKQIISQETFKRDKMKVEADKSNSAIQSSQLLISNWVQQNQDLQSQLREFELTNEFFQSFNSMIKEKIPPLLKQYDSFDDTRDEYYNLIEARLEEEQLLYEHIFDGFPIQILLNYAKDICLLMGDIDEEYLDINRLCDNYQSIMFVSPDIKVLQPVFDYHLILRFIDLYVSDMKDTESDLFAGLVSDQYLLCQLIMKCRFIKGLVILNPTYPKFIQQFILLVLKYTYKYLKTDKPEEAQNCLVFIKSLLDPIIKNVYNKPSVYQQEIMGNLSTMNNILPKESLDKLLQNFTIQGI